MSVPDLKAFREWCNGQQRWSHRAVSDLISRIRKADRVLGIGQDTQVTKYLSQLRTKSEWTSIPRTTQRAIERAVTLYLDFRTQGLTAN